MYEFCQQFPPCALVPPQWHWLMPLVMPLVFAIVIGVPVVKVLHQAGYSRWWTILAFIPLVNLIGLWIFAFSKWPRSR